MRVGNPTPHASIVEYVERILIIEDCKVTNPFVLPLFANGSPTLLFHTAKGKIKNDSSYLTFFGQTVFPEILTIENDFTLVAYFFKPFALFSLFGVSAKELTDYPIELKLLSTNKTSELQEQLLNSKSTEEIVVLLNDYIFALIQKTKTDSRIIKYATNLIITNNASKETLLFVQDKLHLTERTFQRMFEKNIGIAPNLFRRIAQFNAAFQQLNNRKFEKLSDVAFSNGYADQSHYIRTFKEFTNITPKEYLKFGQ